MKLQLKVKKEECLDSCPLPLNVLVGTKEGITKVDYDKKRETAIIEFNEKAISKKEVLKVIKKMKYKVLEVKNG